MAKKKARHRRAVNRKKQQNLPEKETSCDENLELDCNASPDREANIDQEACKSQKTKSPVILSPVGLANLGNTCFFNSILQILIQTSLLNEELKGAIKMAEAKNSAIVAPDELNENGDKTPPLTYVPTGLGQISLALSAFFDAIKSIQSPNQSNGVNGQRKQRNRTFSPKSLFNHICIKNATFRGFQQQDSQELYHCLLDSIKTEEITRKKRGILRALNLEKVKAKDVSDEIRQRVKMYGQHVMHKEDTIIENVFGGKLISSILCDGCGSVTGVTEPFHDLSLPIAEEKRSNHHQKISSTLQSDESDDESQKISTCNKTNLSKHAAKKAKKQAKRQSRQRFLKNGLESADTVDINETRIYSKDMTFFTNLIEEEPIGTVNGNSKSDSFDNFASSMADDVICNALQSLNITDDTSTSKHFPTPSKEFSVKLIGGALLAEDLNLPKEDAVIVASDREEKLNSSQTSSENVATTQSQNSHMSEHDATTDKDSSDEKPSAEKEASLFDTPHRRKPSFTISEFSCNLPESLAPRHHPVVQECSLLSSLYQFTMPEMLTGTNKFGCETCTERLHGKCEGSKKTVYCTASKQMLIKKAPVILTIHLKRFQQTGYNLRKVNKHVSVPTQLDISPFCSVFCKEDADKNMNILYNLYGIVEHYGSLSRGHYTAYVKVRPESSEDSSFSDGVWFHISDSNVSKTTETKALNSNAYLLFYERIR